MIEVRIRHTEQADAVHLMDWNPSRLSEAVKLVRSWELRFYAEDGSELSQSGEVTGAIVVEDGAAYFEVLVSA